MLNIFKNYKQKQETPYSHLSIDERIKRAMNDKSFSDFCKNERQQKYFDDILPIVEKIAQINVSNISYNKSLISGVNIFNAKEIVKDVAKFYEMIDKLDPNNISLTSRLKANMRYFTTKSKDKDARSYCKSDKNKNIKEIFVKIEGRIGDTQTAIHEFGHSFSDVFMIFKRQQDHRLAEIPTVVTDNLSSLFMQEKYPDLQENLIENDIFRQVLNVKKARECLMDAMIVKVMCGEITYDEVMNKYGNIFKQFPDILTTRLKKIETFKFYPMEESKYLVPQAVSLELTEQFGKNPKLVAKQLKHLIKDNHSLTEEQALQDLGFPDRDKLIDDYVDKFTTRIKFLEDKRKSLQNNNVDTELFQQ